MNEHIDRRTSDGKGGRAVLCYLIMGLSSFIYLVFCLLSHEGHALVSLTLITQFVFLTGIIYSRTDAGLFFFTMSFIFFTFSNFLRSIALVLVDKDIFTPYYIWNLSYDSMLIGAIYFLVFAISLVFAQFVATGFERSPARSVLPKNECADTPIPTLAIWIAIGLLAICLLAALSGSIQTEEISTKRIFVGDDGIETRFGPLTFATLIVLMSLFCVLYKKLDEAGLRLSIVTLAIVVIIVAEAVIFSHRRFILFIIIPIIYFGLGRDNIRNFIAISLLLPVLLAAVGFISAARQGSDVSQMSVVEIVETGAKKSLINANFGGSLATAISTDGIKRTAPMFFGTTFFQDPLYQFVPRTLWPNKPEELGGRLRPDLKTANLLPSYVQGGVPPGVVAEFWLNFRLFGVVVSGFAFFFVVMLVEKIGGKFGRFSRPFVLFSVWLMIYFWIGGHTARFILYFTMLVLGVLMLQLLSRITVLPKRGYGSVVRR